MKRHEYRAVRHALDTLRNNSAKPRPYSIEQQAIQLAQVRAGRTYDQLTLIEALSYARRLTNE